MKKVLNILGIVYLILGAALLAMGVALAGTEQNLLLILGSIGLVFFVLGGVFLAIVALRRRQEARLREQGSRILADIVGVRLDRRVSINSRHPFVIDCQAQNPADGKVYVFTSPAIWYDPTPYLRSRTQLTVLVEGDNYRRYLVDTDGILPEQG